MVSIASAVLALLFEEPGAGVVGACLDNASMGVANLAEVLAKLVDHNVPLDTAARAVSMLGVDIVSLTDTQARWSAEIRPVTRKAGLSLGDRACLALAADLGRPAVTADRVWARIATEIGVTVRIIR